ncbi:MAG: HIT domain-containing protein [Nitrospirota bacterium]
MKVLWAPWRIQYILSRKGPGCIFCEMSREDRDRENLILYRGRQNYVIMNRFPYTGGHLMVVPYEHSSSLEGYAGGVLDEMMALARYSLECLSEVLRPEGFNTGINIGQAAGAGIEEHLHMHIVPRWVGDASFMAVLDEVRVVPEHITATYDKLRPVFQRNA